MTSLPSRNREDWLAYAISALFSPYIVLPVLAVATTWRIAPTPSDFLLWTSATLFFLSFVPAAFIVHRIRSGQLSDIHIMVREQRFLVFLVFLASGGVGILTLWQLGVPLQFLSLTALLYLNGLIAALITSVWKISLHSWVLAAAITSFALFTGNRAFWWLLALVPAVMWARIVRNRHTYLQSWAGAVVGILLTALTYYLFFIR